ncbi:MAG: DUF1223 domain-containing protein [Nevskia sp.]|nr:DUF1223 domain-containing protein [Nevskia sp.]
MGKRTGWLPRSAAASVMALAMTLATAATADTAAPQRPLLLELFTSQGCSSCPPADALLRELSSRDDLLPLAFHVDYWNGLGWVDPFSSPAYTARQQAYATRKGFEVYTPQLVVEGHSDVIGSSRADVSAAIASARHEARGAACSIRRQGGEVSIEIGAAAAAGDGAAADVYLLSFDSSDRSRIGGGENSGRELVYVNVVRSLRKIGEWHQRPLSLVEHLQAGESGDRLALLVQERSGTVWAVASTPPAGAN